MDKSLKIGLKYVAIGMLCYFLAGTFLSKVLNQHVYAGTGIGVMCTMIMGASREAYNEGKKENAPITESSEKED